MDAVTQILIDRSREADKLSRMVLLSLVAHAGLIALVMFLPAGWGSAIHENRNVMTISLGGAPGPRQGISPISAKPVQQAAPDVAKPKDQAPPALSKPEMIEPLKTAKPQPKAVAKPEPKKQEPQLHGRTPTTGPEVKSGTARIETGGQAIPFGGLATGGGGTTGYVDVQNFCCPEYLNTMLQLIQRNWQSQQQQDGQVVVKFVIRRDGTLTNVEVEKHSQYFLDMAAQRAVTVTKQLPALPGQFPEDHLTVHLIFQYQR